MNNKRYQEIIDEAYKKYSSSHWTPPSNPNSKLLSDQLWGFTPQQHNRDIFIKEIKTNPMFSEKWGLKIEERELSAIERMEYYGRQYMKEDESMGIDELLKVDYEGLGIPTKLITITYQENKIEVYE